MPLFTKDKALCIYYMLEPTPDNIAIARERFDRELKSARIVLHVRSTRPSYGSAITGIRVSPVLHSLSRGPP